MQRITVRLPIESVPEELRDSLRKAGHTTIPQSVSVTVVADNGDVSATLVKVLIKIVHPIPLNTSTT